MERINGHQTGVTAGAVPLIACDLWEHAYVHCYGRQRADWVAAFLDLLDWSDVERRLATARSGTRTGRGGFYSSERLENLVGCRIANTDEIRSQWQGLAVGDEVGLRPKAPTLLVEPIGFVMGTEMLRGIAERAEQAVGAPVRA